jgi:Bacterial Ig-like domain (group 3)/FG-GAP-like repeat
VVGQTAVTASGKEPVADTALGSASFLLSPMPVITGPLIFLPPVTYSEGNSNNDSGFPTAMADVNGDGKLDLVVINNSNTVIVLLGNGDGSFQAPQSYSTGLASSEGITIADLNGDGKPDLVLTGCGVSCFPGDVAVLLGNGDGSFKTAVLYGTGGWVGQSVAVADVNLDGKADLVVVNVCTTINCTGYGALGVMLGKGDGTFEPVVTYSTGGFGSSEVTIADVNGDGNPDLLVANRCNPKGCTSYDQSHEVGVLLGRGDGTFRSVVGYASGGVGADSVTAIDLNGDGKLDLVVENQCMMANCPFASDSIVGVLLGNGDGTFQAAMSYDTGGMLARGLTVADVNGDGKPDLIMTGFCNENSVGCGSALANLFALLGNGNGTFQPGEILYMLGAIGGPETLLVGDLNDDGNPDLVAVHGCNYLNCPSNDVEVGVMLNNRGAPATTISLTSSKNPVPLFTTVTYTAKVAGGSGGTLSGTVTFADGNSPAKTVTLSANQAKYSTTYRTAGNHLMTASYSGVFHTDEGSRSVTLTENAVDPTTTALATSGSPTFVGQPVTFTTTVTSTYGAIPNGELVKFYDGGTLLASVALSGGKATYTTSKLTAKTHGMKAVYVGDSMFATSTGYVTQVVELYPTTTTLTCSPNPSSFGQVVTMTATVKSSGPATPTGKVIFRDGPTWIGAGILSGGVATITRSNFAVGTHAIKATYGGDSNAATSTSAVVNQVVN